MHEHDPKNELSSLGLKKKIIKIVNKFSLLHYFHLPLEKYMTHHLNRPKFTSPMEALYLKLAHWFWTLKVSIYESCQ